MTTKVCMPPKKNFSWRSNNKCICFTFLTYAKSNVLKSHYHVTLRVCCSARHEDDHQPGHCHEFYLNYCFKVIDIYLYLYYLLPKRYFINNSIINNKTQVALLMAINAEKKENHVKTEICHFTY